MQSVNCMNMSKEQLLNYIGEVSFAIIDMQLFLDTHPDHMDAKDYIRKYTTLRTKAMQTYANKYEPLNMDYVDQEPCMNGGMY